MQLNLVADRVVRGKIYPSLARFQAEPYTMEWRQFNQHWPNTIPIRLQEYFEGHGVPIQIFNVVDDLPELTYYPIALGWFNFGIDYFALLSPDIKIQLQQLQEKEITLAKQLETKYGQGTISLETNEFLPNV